MGYKVIVPLVITKNEDGSDRYVYEDALLPSHVKGAELSRLLDGKFVAEEGSAAASGEAPAKSAPKSEWVDFAAEQGDDDPESKTKEQLVSEYGN